MPVHIEDISSEVQPGAGGGSGITPELIEKVTERVFQLWKEELRIERERHRSRRDVYNRRGGF